MVAGYRKAQRHIDDALGAFFVFTSYKIATSDRLALGWERGHEIPKASVTPAH